MFYATLIYFAVSYFIQGEQKGTRVAQTWRELPTPLVVLHLQWCARANALDVFHPSPMAETNETCILSWLQLCPGNMTVPACLHLLMAAPRLETGTPRELPAEPNSHPAAHKRLGLCNRSGPGSRQTSRATDSSAGGCHFWQGVVKAPAQLVQGKDLCWWLDPLSR